MDMGSVSGVFADLSWRRGLCAKKPRSGIANGGGAVTGGRCRRERGAGRRPFLRGSAAVRTRWLSGTERFPFDFAIGGGSKGGGLGVEK